MAQKPYRKKEVVQDDFDKLTNYDSKRDMNYFNRRLKRLLDVVPKDKKIRILDFGGGSGLFSLELKRKGYKNLELVDISSSQCAQAREKGLKNVHNGDEEYVVKHFKESFDFIFMCDVIEHLENPSSTLINIGKVLKPGGLLFLTYPNPLWVPFLNFLGNINLKLKGKDNKIYIRKIKKDLEKYFVFKLYEGHMLASMLPKLILKFFEYVELVIPISIKRDICILNIVVLSKKRIHPKK